MILKAFAIMDLKTGAYMQPWFCLTVGQATRTFGDAVMDSQSPLNKHPGDYELYQLGEFDDNSGVLTPLDKPQYVIRGSDFTEKEALKVVNHG